jgi:hypothetical protein
VQTIRLSKMKSVKKQSRTTPDIASNKMVTVGINYELRAF